MRPPLHRRAPKTARHAALHRMSDLDSENQAPSLDHRVGAAILHALTAIGYAVTSDTRLTVASNIPVRCRGGARRSRPHGASPAPLRIGDRVALLRRLILR